jgi:hypothetical protein
VIFFVNRRTTGGTRAYWEDQHNPNLQQRQTDGGGILQVMGAAFKAFWSKRLLQLQVKQ